MKVYGHPLSTCTRKVLITLAEKEARHDFSTVDLTKGEHKQPAHLARQPFGQVPALEDGAFSLYESRAIIRYLDAKLPGVSLAPKDLEGRAKMEQWMSVESSNFTPVAMKLIYQLVFNKLRGLPTDAAVVDQAKKDIAAPLRVLDEALAGKDWLVGTFSLADVCYAPYLAYLDQAGVLGELLAPFANAAAWWKRLSERPSVKRVVAR
ncbi:MAG TPA: glutathione S-transferase N-terminal domain-containing protein [Minicystis sp.]|nr:glutathione S-transferase N-terminal domain-containing protein [Minicystis sp.]